MNNGRTALNELGEPTEASILGEYLRLNYASVLAWMSVE